MKFKFQGSYVVSWEHSHAQLFTPYLWLLSCYNGRVESSWRRLYGLQSRKYFLSSLYSKFGDPWSAAFQLPGEVTPAYLSLREPCSPHNCSPPCTSVGSQFLEWSMHFTRHNLCMCCSFSSLRLTNFSSSFTQCCPSSPERWSLMTMPHGFHLCLIKLYPTSQSTAMALKLSGTSAPTGGLITSPVAEPVPRAADGAPGRECTFLTSFQAAAAAGGPGTTQEQRWLMYVSLTQQWVFWEWALFYSYLNHHSLAQLQEFLEHSWNLIHVVCPLTELQWGLDLQV